MPRLELYKTAAEKKEANCAKSRRSYLKNKEIIALRRQAWRNKQKGMDVPETIQPDSQPCTESHLDYCLRQARQVNDRFDKLTRGNSMIYMEKIYSAFEIQFNDGDADNTEIIENEITDLVELQSSIIHWQDGVLQEAGVGKEWDEVEDIRRRVHAIICYLEEMLCEVMVDPKGLIAAHHSHRLRYQELKLQYP